MDAFPAFFALSGRLVVVAGTSDGAQAKARLFENSPATLTRIDGDGALAPASYAGALMAFIDLGDDALSAKAAEAARGAGALVNVVDRPALSDFSTPAIVDRGQVVAAIGTAGASPMLAAVLRGEIESRVPEGAGRVAALLHEMRDEIRAALPDTTQRRAFLRDLVTGSVAQSALDGRAEDAQATLRAMLAAPGGRQGIVWLLDGSGPVDLLSLRALRALSEADAVAADPSVDSQILARARRDAPRLSEGDIGSLPGRALMGERVVRILARAPDGADLEAAQAGGAKAAILPVAAP